MKSKLVEHPQNLITKHHIKELQFIIFYGVKWTCIICLLTSWILIFAACITISLQLVFVLENGYVKTGNELYYRWFQAFFLPHFLIVWAFICSFILSRQSDLIYLVFSSPYFSTEDIINAENSVGVMQLADVLLHRFMTHNNKEKYTQIYLTFFICLCVIGIVLIIIFLVFFSNNALEQFLFIVLWFFICATYLCAFNMNAYLLFWIECFFVTVAAIVTTIWMMVPNPPYSVGSYHKLVIIFAFLFTTVSIVYIFFELYCVPCAMLLLSDHTGNISYPRLENFFSFYYYPFMQQHTVSTTAGDNNLSSVSTSYYLILAWILFILFGSITLISLAISFHFYLFASDMMIDFNARFAFEWSLIILSLLSLIVFGSTQSRQHLSLSHSMIAFSFRGLVCLFVLFGIAMLLGEYVMISSDVLVGLINAGLYIFGWVVALFFYLNELFSILYLLIFFIICSVWNSFTSAVFLLFLISHGIVLMRHYALSKYTMPLRPTTSTATTTHPNEPLQEQSNNTGPAVAKLIREDEGNEEKGLDIMENATPMEHDYGPPSHADNMPFSSEEPASDDDKDVHGISHVNSYYLQVHTLFQHRFPTHEKKNAAATVSPNEDDDDACIQKWQYLGKGYRRIYLGYFLVFIFCHAVFYLLAIWAQEQDIQSIASHSRGASNRVLVNPSDIILNHHRSSYGICHSNVFTLDIVDMSYLAEMLYLVDPTDDSKDCGLQGNHTNLERCLSHYFNDKYTKPTLDYQPYNWKVLNISLPTTRTHSSNARHNTRLDHAAYYVIQSTAAQLIVIGVRGSITGRDWLEDFNLYSQIVSVQLISFFLPLVYLWPMESTAWMVYIMSYVTSLSFLERNPYANTAYLASYYYEEVTSTVMQLEKHFPESHFLLIGHSLGGAVAGIVGAQRNITSVTFEPPGIVYSKIKFNISGGIEAIYDTNTNIVREYDPVVMVDRQGGVTQRVTCPVNTLSTYCHSIHPISCHFLASCQHMNNSINYEFWGGPWEYCL